VELILDEGVDLVNAWSYCGESNGGVIIFSSIGPWSHEYRSGRKDPLAITAQGGESGAIVLNDRLIVNKPGPVIHISPWGACWVQGPTIESEKIKSSAKIAFPPVAPDPVGIAVGREVSRKVVGGKWEGGCRSGDNRREQPQKKNQRPALKTFTVLFHPLPSINSKVNMLITYGTPLSDMGKILSTQGL
jgi:hypothetical protein